MERNAEDAAQADSGFVPEHHPDSQLNVKISTVPDSQKLNPRKTPRELPPAAGKSLSQSKSAIKKRKYLSQMTQEQKEEYRKRETLRMRTFRKNQNNEMREKIRDQNKHQKRQRRQAAQSSSGLYSDHAPSSSVATTPPHGS